jgi:transposase
MNKNLPPEQDRERLNQLPKEELVEIIIRQAIVIEQLHKAIAELKQEIEKLLLSRNLDSKTSSKPPSSDLLKKPETQKEEKPAVEEKPLRRPGGAARTYRKNPKGIWSSR